MVLFNQPKVFILLHCLVSLKCLFFYIAQFSSAQEPENQI